MDEINNISNSKEIIHFETKPTFVSFLPFQYPSIYLLFISLYFLLRKESIFDSIPSIFSGDLGMLSFYLFLSLIILIPAVAISFMKLNLRYLIIASFLLFLAFFIKHKLLNEPWDALPQEFTFKNNFELYFLSISAMISIFYTELYRKSHRYLISNTKIHTYAGILSKNERVLPINKINDFSLSTGLIGKVFNYSTVVPVTASGMGMGFNFAALSGSSEKRWLGAPSVGISLSGGHAIQVPKSRTFEALYGVPDGSKIVNLVMDDLSNRQLNMHVS